MTEPLPDDELIAVPVRSLDEIYTYLHHLRGFQRKEIAFEAAIAIETMREGNFKPAQDVLIRWYQTLRQGTDHRPGPSMSKPLDYDEVMISKDKDRHMDLILQMIATLATLGVD